MAFSDVTHFASPTGATLALRHEPAAGTARGVVQINHGMCEHSARYETFAKELSEAGYHVYAHDHRGHGLTKVPGNPPHVFSMDGDGGELVLADVAAVHAHIRESHPGLPVVIFGHSMGSMIAMNYALRHAGELAGAAIWNGNFTGGLQTKAGLAVLAWEKFRLGSDAPSPTLAKLTFRDWAKKVKDRRTDFDWISHDPAVVDAYIADPDCGWDATVDIWRATLRWAIGGSSVADASPEAKALPFQLIGGRQDPESDFGKTVDAQARRMERAGFANVTLQIYPEYRHETLNEIGREKAVGDFIAWLGSVAAPA